MKGQELYNSFVLKRDYSGSPADVYAQFLMTLFFQLGKDLFLLLETAEFEQKTLQLKPQIVSSKILINEYSLEDIILV